MDFTAKEVADLLRVSPLWVRQHAHELGGYKLGNGITSSLRFPSSAIANYQKARQAQLIETRA